MAEDILNHRYVLQGPPLGQGGMGQVHLAVDQRLGRAVVIKLIRLRGDRGDEDRVRRFFDREARLAAQLDHPGIPTVYDVGRQDDRPYLVMQRIDGISIDDLMVEHDPLPIGWVAAIGAQVCSVLMAAHDAGLIHRDIKPENLMLDRRGGVKVLDFGVAGVFGRSDVSRITRTGEGLGTVPYMAPEQFTSDESTPLSDLYGLGCTLCELLTGAPPFEADNDLVLMNMHMSTTPAPLRDRRPEIPTQLDELVLAMLEKQPADRPTASTVYDRLTPFVADLPDLPGVLAPSIDPVRAYHALNRHLPVVEPPDPTPRLALDRQGLASALSQAGDLLAMGSYDQVTRLLDPIMPQAVRAFDGADADVAALRELYATALLATGSFRAAARELRALAHDLARRHSADDPRVLACRWRVARAHAGLKEMSRARTLLTDLLDDYLRLHGPDHSHVLDLRAEIEAIEAA